MNTKHISIFYIYNFVILILLRVEISINKLSGHLGYRMLSRTKYGFCM